MPSGVPQAGPNVQTIFVRRFIPTDRTLSQIRLDLKQPYRNVLIRQTSYDRLRGQLK